MACPLCFFASAYREEGDIGGTCEMWCFEARCDIMLMPDAIKIPLKLIQHVLALTPTIYALSVIGTSGGWMCWFYDFECIGKSGRWRYRGFKKWVANNTSDPIYIASGYGILSGLLKHVANKTSDAITYFIYFIFYIKF